jgi:uncharacterized repeat protein (TIGR02543 family)
MPEEDVELTANFLPVYVLSLIVSPDGAGNTAGAGSYTANSTVSVTAYNNFGFDFVNWTDADGQLVSSFPEYTFTMPANDLTLTANFEESQTTIIEDFPWNEHFEGAVFPPQGWTTVNEEGSVLWTSNNAPGGGLSAFHVYGNYLEDDWLITPAISIPEGGVYLLSFMNYNYYSSYYPGYGGNSVLVSTGSPNPADDEYELIWSPETVTETWEETILELDSYGGDTIYIAFRYYAEYTHNWYVDDVKITGVPQITINPGYLSEIIEPGTIDTVALELFNAGYGDLEWSAMVQVPFNSKNKAGLENSAVKSRNTVLHYDGENEGSVGLQSGGELTAAAMFPDEITVQYNTYQIKSLDLFIVSEPMEATIKIWGAGTPDEPGPLLVQQAFEAEPFSWNNVLLDTPVYITNEDIWIGYSVTHEALATPIGMDAGPALPGGDWVYINNQWSRMSEVSSFDANFNIRANLVLSDYWLDIYPYEGTITPGGTQIMDVVIDAEGLAIGNYQSAIIIQTNDPVNGVTSIPVTLDVLTGINEKKNELVLIYPSPAKSMVNISSSCKIMSIEVLDTSGKTIQRINTSGQTSIVINTEKMLPGIYPVVITCVDDIKHTAKIVIQ